MKSASPAPRPGRALWSCPRCCARFVTRNAWHSCVRATLAEWRSRMGPRARRLYARIARLVADCGPIAVALARTRISFMGRVRFANVNRLSERGMSCDFALPRPMRAARLARVKEVASGWWVHELRVRSPGELDAQVASWLRRSYRLMGMQQRLATRRRSRA